MDASEQPDYQRSAAEIEVLIEAGARVIDVRAAHEFDAAHLVGAERIGLEVLADHQDELDPDVPIVFYCRVGNRSVMAADAFGGSGFDVNSLDGGIVAWIEDGKAIEPADGYVAEPGGAAAILESRARAAGH